MAGRPGTQSTSATRKFTRRQVLASGSLAAAAGFVPRLTWSQTLGEPVRASGDGAMAVAYLEGSDVAPDLRRFASSLGRDVFAAADEAPVPYRIVSADSVAADASLWGQPLRVRVHGLGAVERNGLPLFVDLDVLVPSPDPAVAEGPLPFHAWSCQGHGLHASPPVSFVLPPCRESLPELRLTMRDERGEAVSVRTRFTMGHEPGLPRLRRGTYLLSATGGRASARGLFARWGVAPPALASSICISFDAEPNATV